MNRFSEKLSKMIQILSTQYDIGFDPDSEEMWKAHERMKHAEYIYKDMREELDYEKREIIGNLLDAAREEANLKMIYTYLCGLKHGVSFRDWLKDDNQPFYVQMAGEMGFTDSIAIKRNHWE